MPRDPSVFLWEPDEASANVLEFTAGMTLEQLKDDLLVRSAVERQLHNMGEALAQLTRAHPSVAERVPNLGNIVRFRNMLVHGYRELNYQTVWLTITRDVPALRRVLRALLDELGS